MQDSVDVSIVVCTRNRSAALAATLESLREINVPDDLLVEVIFVDNGSSDDTVGVMNSFRHPRIRSRIVLEDRPGLSRARNRGIAEARGAILLFTDDDVRFPESWLAGMTQPIRDGRADVVAGGVVIPEPLHRGWMTPVHRSWMASTEQIDPVAPHRVVGANMAVSKRVFSVVREFDPELGAGALGYGEETLFTAQVRHAGFRIVSSFDVALEHHFDEDRLSRDNYLRMARNMGRSQAYIRHHWQQRRTTLVKSSFEIVARTLQLSFWRITKRSEIEKEGAPMWELSTVRKLHMHLQLLRERRRASRYANRFQGRRIESVPVAVDLVREEAQH